jgi:hypothetical protein
MSTNGNGAIRETIEIEMDATDTEQFVIVGTITDHVVADNACGVLEAAGIPVLLEHIEIVHEGRREAVRPTLSLTNPLSAGMRSLAHGIRILVPSQNVERALSLIANFYERPNRKTFGSKNASAAA